MSKMKNSIYSTAARKAERGKPEKVRATRFCILFWQRKIGKHDLVTINVRLTYGRMNKNVSTGVRCRRGELDAALQTTPNNPDADRLLTELRNRLNATYSDFRVTGRPIDVDLIWKVAAGVLPSASDHTIASCLGSFQAQLELECELGEISLSTFKKTQTWHKRLTAFSIDAYGSYGNLDDVVPADAKRLLLWLKKEYGYTHNVATMIVAHFKRVLNYALENEWITRNPFMNYRRKFEKLKTERLTEAEVDLIRDAEIFAPAVEHIRRAFVFQCYTGLSYAELCKVNVNNLLVDKRTGAEYIKIDRTKTGVESNIPLAVEARKIIDSFSEHPRRKQFGLLIPTISNQKYNVHLKQLAGLVGLDKRLTSHVARRTAATIYLKKGAPLESVSAMLGHSSTQMTQKHYTVMDSERVVKDFNAIVELSKVSNIG